MNAALALRMTDFGAELPAVVAPADPDAETVRRAAAGDVRAFEALYRRHVGRVFGAIRRLVGGVEARAEELTQEAFVRAWQKLDSFRFQSLFGTWLYRLAINTALMEMRSRVGAEDREDTLEDDVQLPVVDTRRRQEQRIDLEAAIATLPPRARAVLILHDVEGWRHQDIGAELGMAVGSSKAQLHRARGLLRRVLGESDE